MTKLVSWAASLACLPSKGIEVGRFGPLMDPSLTVNKDLDLVINAFHFDAYFLRRFSCLLAV